ncbi:MAG: hypothetical protein WD342_19440 [Verrucomicrobiales bacterium]
MKRRTLICHSNLGQRGLLVAAAASIFAASAFAQVTIPARSSSSLDDQTDDPATEPTTPPVQLTSPFPGKSSVSRVRVPTPGVEEGKVTTQTTPATDTPPSVAVVATQRVAPVERGFNVITIRRLAELRRELRVADAALKTMIALPADELFEDEESLAIDDLAAPALHKVIEYIELNDKKKVTVRSLYNREEGAKELGRERSVALIKWMMENSPSGLDDFEAAAPAPVAKPTAKQNATEVGDTEYVNRIELLLE